MLLSISCLLNYHAFIASCPHVSHVFMNTLSFPCLPLPFSLCPHEYHLLTSHIMVTMTASHLPCTSTLPPPIPLQCAHHTMQLSTTYPKFPAVQHHQNCLHMFPVVVQHSWKHLNMVFSVCLSYFPFLGVMTILLPLNLFHTISLLSTYHSYSCIINNVVVTATMLLMPSTS